jgi:hypothetical protein
VDVFVAATADDKHLAPPHGHEVHPGGFFGPAGLVEIGKFSDVVNLEAHRQLADLTAGEEPVDQLIPFGAGHDRPLVGDACKARKSNTRTICSREA